MSIYNRNEPEPGEWQTDPKTGERFRMIGHIKEYEPVTYISGIPVPQSQIADFHKRQKEAEERRKAAAAEQCFREQKKKRAREYQADRRAAQRALDAFYNEQYARERRERLAQAKEAYDRKRAAK